MKQIIIENLYLWKRYFDFGLAPFNNFLVGKGMPFTAYLDMPLEHF
jgi:hypothetical protein